MALLKRVSATLPAAGKSKKSEHPLLVIESDAISRYNGAIAAMKEAEGTVALLRPEVETVALEFLYEHNTENKGGQVSTVKVKDATGAVIRVSSQDKYSAADADAVSGLFDGVFHKDVNAYFTETVKASFDSKFFLNTTGDFDQSLFDQVQTAIAAIAKKANKPNPLAAKTVVIPKPGFHTRRFVDFTIEENEQIQSTVKNTVTMTPMTKE